MRSNSAVSAESRSIGKVFLVGAGPGDPGLLTLRGRECLAQADFVLYDQLVSHQILAMAPATAEKQGVRELAECHPDRWPHIHVRMIEEAQLGRCVVRLKGGDPMIFGRGGEEALALREAGIPYEIVPGVTAALAAGACLEIPLTHRSLASAVAFITGHEHPGKPSSRLDWKAIAAFPGTLVLYMGFSRLNSILPELVRHGMDPTTPAAAVTRASSGDQRSVTATIATLDAEIRAAGLTTPALVLIGPVVGLRPALSWFESRPLLGRHILVTRPRHQATDLLHELAQLGATPELLPAIDIREPTNMAAFDEAIERVAAGKFAWLIFTSANGVSRFFDRLFLSGRDIRALGHIKLAAIGSATAAELRKLHLDPDIAPAEGMNSEHLADELTTKVDGQHVLLAQAEEGRELLRERLAMCCKLETVAVYRQVEAIDPQAESFNRLRRGEIDDVIVTSPNIARTLLNACDATILERLRRGQIRMVSSNPRTSATVREFGIETILESASPTMESVVECLTQNTPTG